MRVNDNYIIKEDVLCDFGVQFDTYFKIIIFKVCPNLYVMGILILCSTLSMLNESLIFRELTEYSTDNLFHKLQLSDHYTL